MVTHEVEHWDSDSEWADDEEKDELDQDPLMTIQDRVRPAELREMSVADICRMGPILPIPQDFEKLTADRAHTRWPYRLEPGISKR